MQIVGATGLGGLWALEWAWHPAETRSARSSEICMPNPNSLALIVSEISAFIRTDGFENKTSSLWAPHIFAIFHSGSYPDQEYIFLIG